MLLKPLNFLKGSVRIEITGAGIEKFLNLCAAGGIDFWDVKRLSFDKMAATVGIPGFRRLRRHARRAMCRVHIAERRGLPFFTVRFKRRYALFGGFLLGAAVLWMLCGCIWTVRVDGCAALTQDEVLKALERNGFFIGMRAKDVDAERLRDRVLTELDELLWMTVNVSGSHADVFVKEREKRPEVIDTSDPCHVAARRDGLILSVIAEEGVAKVKAGDMAAKGDILIEGKHLSALAGLRLVHAMGEVRARTWHTWQAVTPAPANAYFPTGRETARFALVIGGTRINLYINSGNPYKSCDKITEKKILYAGENFRMPVCLVKERYLETAPADPAEYDTRAGEILKETLEKKLADAVGEGEIVSRKFSVVYKNGVYVGILQAECLEDIAMPVRIGRTAQ